MTCNYFIICYTLNMNQTDLQNAGYKLTKPRQRILDLMNKNHIPLSANDIGKKLKNIDLVTVYRSLNLFVTLGICQLELLNGEQYYYLAEKQHHHVVCSKCGRMECVPCHHQYQLKNFSHIKHSLTLTGLCTACANQ